MCKEKRIICGSKLRYKYTSLHMKVQFIHPCFTLSDRRRTDRQTFSRKLLPPTRYSQHGNYSTNHPGQEFLSRLQLLHQFRQFFFLFAETTNSCNDRAEYIHSLPFCFFVIHNLLINFFPFSSSSSDFLFLSLKQSNYCYFLQSLHFYRNWKSIKKPIYWVSKIRESSDDWKQVMVP